MKQALLILNRIFVLFGQIFPVLLLAPDTWVNKKKIFTEKPFFIKFRHRSTCGNESGVYSHYVYNYYTDTYIDNKCQGGRH